MLNDKGTRRRQSVQRAERQRCTEAEAIRERDEEKDDETSTHLSWLEQGRNEKADRYKRRLLRFERERGRRKGKWRYEKKGLRFWERA